MNDLKKTTLSIHSKLIESLVELADKTGLSTDHIVAHCLNRYSIKSKIVLELDKLTTYQPRCFQYNAYHITLPQVLYEKCFDLRKASKLSLSYIFAIAFQLYSKELLISQQQAKSEKLLDSYQSNSYNGSYICENGARFFVYIWKNEEKRWE